MPSFLSISNEIVPSFRIKRQVALPFAKNSPFFYSFQKVLLMLDQSGALDQIQDKYLLESQLKEMVKCENQVCYCYT